jgi:hypothetical protein
MGFEKNNSTCEMGTSRRSFIQASAAVVGATALGSTAAAQDGAYFQQFGPIDRNRGASRYALVQRTSFGHSPATMQRFDDLGYEAFLEEQLNPELIDDTECQVRLNQYLSLDQSPYWCVRDQSTDEDWECVQAQIVRAIYTKKQL